jgi:hypothetical protein
VDDLPAQLRAYIDGVAAPVELTEVVTRVSGEGATIGTDGSRPERAYLPGRTDHEMVALATPHARRRRAIAVLAAVAAVIVVTVAVVVTRPGAHHQQQSPVVPPPTPTTVAQPQLYWRDATGIGRANLDGTGIHRLIPFTVGVNQGSSVTNGGCGLAVDHDYLYWPTGDTLARAKLDGTGVDTGFIATGPGTNCVAVDGGHIYWVTTGGATSDGTIGRANLDGTGAQRAFIPDANAPCGVAVDGAHLYWANSSTGAIGRANIDGTGVNQDFVTGYGPPPACGVVVDRAHIAWGDSPVTTGCLTCFEIAIANLDGTAPGGYFSTGLGPLGSFELPCADDGTYLYWTYSFNGVGSPPPAWIGRANIHGAHDEQPPQSADVRGDYITTGPDTPVGAVTGCAIGPLPATAAVPQPGPVVPPPSPTIGATSRLYWQDDNGIGRANLDGTGITRNFVPVGGYAFCGGTVAADRNYVYWTVPGPPARGGGEIARARRDGTGVDQTFITTTSPYMPQCVAVDGAYVYWTSIITPPPTAGPQFVVGRANLDGTGVQESFISGVNAFCLATDGAHIYWGGNGGGIGRANVDGTGVNRNFITAGVGCGLAVDGAHIYWANNSTGAIGRANIDGTGVNQDFIPSAVPGSGALLCADDGTYLYWIHGLTLWPPPPSPTGSIGRARLDGTGGAQKDFITGLTTPSGCAIGP